MERREEGTGPRIALYKTLIDGYGRFPIQRPSNSARAMLYRELIDGFVPLHERCVAVEAQQIQHDLAAIQVVVSGYSQAVEQWRKRQVDTADEFNILEVLDLTHKEARHSMMLAWLLDRDMMKFGTHAQGSLGFGIFLEELGLPAGYADEAYWVRRELSGDESRIDIEVAARGRFIIHIENKIWSDEGKDQTVREWADMKRRAQAIGIPETERKNSLHGLFLTPTSARVEDPDEGKCYRVNQLAGLGLKVG